MAAGALDETAVPLAVTFDAGLPTHPTDIASGMATGARERAMCTLQGKTPRMVELCLREPCGRVARRTVVKTGMPAGVAVPTGRAINLPDVSARVTATARQTCVFAPQRVDLGVIEGRRLERRRRVATRAVSQPGVSLSVTGAALCRWFGLPLSIGMALGAVEFRVRPGQRPPL